MKRYYFLALILACSYFLIRTTYAYNDQNIKDEVQAEGFTIGNDSDLGGSFYYIVDKTSGLCFAGTYHVQGASGLTEVSCEKLRKIASINKFLGPKPKKKAKTAPPQEVKEEIKVEKKDQEESSQEKKEGGVGVQQKGVGKAN